MNIHITKIYNHFGAAAISQDKVSKIAQELGFKEMGLFYYPSETDNDQELSKRIDGILASLEYGDIVFIQSPSWNLLRYDRTFIQKVRAYRDVKIVIFVHDIIPILFDSGEENLRATIEIYNYADLIILPTEGILRYLQEKGLTVEKYLIQKVWDYPISFETNVPQFQKRIFFTGAQSRFPFVKEWKYKTQLTLYSFERVLREDTNIVQHDYQRETPLLLEFSKGGFGLVWPSESKNNNYLYLQPYKVGNFLAAGIPLIVKKGLASEKIVIENGLGFVVDTLEEADEIVQSITEEEYNKMVKRISEFNFLIKDGWFTKKLLTDAIHYLLDDTFENKI